MNKTYNFSGSYSRFSAQELCLLYKMKDHWTSTISAISLYLFFEDNYRTSLVSAYG